MSHIIEIVQDYMQNCARDTAVMINGEWGSGKTYFIKNKLITEIGIDKCVYISLNGVNSVDEITDRILLSILGSDNKTGRKFLNSLYKFGTTAHLGKKSAIVQDILSAFSGCLKDITTRSQLKDSLLIIDDLERVSTDFRIEDVLGYICSNYIESINQKVLFVCNEVELNEKNDYKRIKEKSVSITVDYLPNLRHIFEQLVARPSFQNNKIFIEKMKEIGVAAIDLLERSMIKNLRTIIRILEVFEKVVKFYSEDMDTAFALRLFRSVTMLVNEKSLGEPLIDDQEVIEIMRQDAFMLSLMNTIESEKKDCRVYVNSMIDKYFDENSSQWLYLISVYEFVTKYYFDKEEFLHELRSYINPQDPSVNALNQFHSIYYHEKESEVQQILIELTEYVKQDSYDPRDLYNIYMNLQYIYASEIDKTHVQEIESIILNKFKQTIEQHTNPYDLKNMYDDLSISKLVDKFKDEIEPVYNSKIQSLKESQVKLRFTKFFSQSKDDPRCYTDSKEMIRSGNLFKEIVENNLISNFYEMSSPALMSVRTALGEAMPKSIGPDHPYQTEIAYIDQIISAFSENLSQDPWKRNIQTMFIDTLKDAVGRYRQTT